MQALNCIELRDVRLMSAKLTVSTMIVLECDSHALWLAKPHGVALQHGVSSLLIRLRSCMPRNHQASPAYVLPFVRAAGCLAGCTTSDHDKSYNVHHV
jgi:hypothetical protein